MECDVHKPSMLMGSLVRQVWEVLAGTSHLDDCGAEPGTSPTQTLALGSDGVCPHDLLLTACSARVRQHPETHDTIDV